MNQPNVLSGRNSLAAFWLGVLAVSIGVATHIPMFLDAAPNNYKMVGMPMCWPMLAGMGLIVFGTFAAGYGLMPRNTAAAATMPDFSGAPAKDTERLTAAHWELLLVLAIALIIDTMKPATLGFVIPGTLKEYGLDKPHVALLPFAGLTGTAIGSYVWGMLADRLGRRSAILLAAIMFIGTSICGAMPSFTWNLIMCWFMGLAAGGMMPIAYTLMAETIPAKHRGWALVLLGGLGLIGGYFAASGLAHVLEPHFGWRILWLLGMPTGLALIFFNRFIPESPRFLLMQGRTAEAKEIMDRFGMSNPYGRTGLPHKHESESGAALFRKPLLARTIELNLAALAWGLVNFGILLWLPSELAARGITIAKADGLLFKSSLIALPTTVAVALMYSRWSTKWTLTACIALTGAGLMCLPLLGGAIQNPVVALAILMTGANGIIAVLLPYSAENYPLYIRGRGTGLVAALSKAGGIAAQIVTMAGLVPALGAAAMILAAPIAASAALIAVNGIETRDRHLEQFDD